MMCRVGARPGGRGEGDRVNARYRVNRPHVISETIDGETVMIDLRTGSYFSLDATAAAVWRGIEAGASLATIVSVITAAQAGPAEDVEADVGRLAAELLADDLIAPADDDDPESPFDPGAGPYRTPVLEKFTDMQDLLLLDPVHDVDSRGWPHQADEIDA